MLSVPYKSLMLSVTYKSFIWSVIMLNVIILNVIMQIVVAPFDLAGLLETDLHLSPEKKLFLSSSSFCQRSAQIFVEKNQN
jgi:hypothetical protein